ncbi:MAG TPA: thioredoxin [Chloroflexota bacterium]|jgi:thioredoxin 1
MGKHISPADPQRLTTVLAGSEPVLVDFWAPWCKPCLLLERSLDELGIVYEGKLTMVKVNLEDHPDVAGSYGVSSLPTLLFFKGGQEVYRAIGALPKTKIDTVIQKVIAAA